MRIGLLQCDDVDPALQARHGNYPAMFERLFHAVDASLEFVVWRCLDGELPDDIDAVDAWLTTGSRSGVNDGDAWIEALCVWVRELWAARKPLVGICFGHQLIARALGGEVAKHQRGWGVGVSFNQVTQYAEWMVPQAVGLDLVVSHQDQVVTLPPETRVLAGSDFCPYYLMQVGECFLGVQGHPEFSKAYSADLMARRRGKIPDNRVREGLASLQAPVDDLQVVGWILAFMRQAGAWRSRLR